MKKEEVKSKLETLHFNSLRQTVDKVNELGLQKDDILMIMPDTIGGGYFLLFYNKV